MLSTSVGNVLGSATGTPRHQNRVHSAVLTTLSCWLGLPKEAFFVVVHSHADSKCRSRIKSPQQSNRPSASFFLSLLLVFWLTIFCQKKSLPKLQDICMSKTAQGSVVHGSNSLTSHSISWLLLSCECTVVLVLSADSHSRFADLRKLIQAF